MVESPKQSRQREYVILAAVLAAVVMFAYATRSGWIAAPGPAAATQPAGEAP